MWLIHLNSIWLLGCVGESESEAFSLLPKTGPQKTIFFFNSFNNNSKLQHRTNVLHVLTLESSLYHCIFSFSLFVLPLMIINRVCPSIWSEFQFLILTFESQRVVCSWRVCWRESTLYIILLWDWNRLTSLLHWQWHQLNSGFRPGLCGNLSQI